MSPSLAGSRLPYPSEKLRIVKLFNAYTHNLSSFDLNWLPLLFLIYMINCKVQFLLLHRILPKFARIAQVHIRLYLINVIYANRIFLKDFTSSNKKDHYPLCHVGDKLLHEEGWVLVVADHGVAGQHAGDNVGHGLLVHLCIQASLLKIIFQIVPTIIP